MLKAHVTTQASKIDALLLGSNDRKRIDCSSIQDFMVMEGWMDGCLFVVVVVVVVVVVCGAVHLFSQRSLPRKFHTNAKTPTNLKLKHESKRYLVHARNQETIPDSFS